MRVLIVDNGTSYWDSLVKYFKNDEYKVVKISFFEYYDQENFDLIILSGGHPKTVVRHPEVYKNEIELVRNAKVPILGICMGFEIIVYAMGGKLKELSRLEKGIIQINKLLEDSIFEGIDKINVFENHRWVAEDLPDNLIALASSKDGIEVIKSKDGLIYGFQFHPEVIQGVGSKIFENYLELLRKP